MPTPNPPLVHRSIKKLAHVTANSYIVTFRTSSLSMVLPRTHSRIRHCRRIFSGERTSSQKFTYIEIRLLCIRCPALNFSYISQMEDNITNSIIELQKVRNWRQIVDKYHDHPERSKVLWVFPSEENLRFIKCCLEELHCDRILSIGCGSGLLEWMITEVTDILVTGVEVDKAWWQCKYAPPTFIPLLITPPALDRGITEILQNSNTTAVLFCYFNNRRAFEDYLKVFSGNVMIIIGPDGKGIHTDPKPFDDVNEDWKLYKFEEVRNSKDFIAVYLRNTQK